MATIVLGAVGGLIGGPIGSVIGVLAGQAADAAIFAPKARQGPRLGELAVQTSSYGTQIPKLFGTMRAAGTVIWSTDLREERSTSGGGKGRPKTVEYSYSASFAVALSGRPIRTVRRVWADGKLLRGEAGDFKTKTKFRLYLGEEDQEVDPFIASAEGVGASPAYRGIAYAMFEDFELADYGNRIPSLTFEVEADEGAVAVGSIAEALSRGAVAAGETPVLIGYAASGESVRGAIEGLNDVFAMSIVDRDGLLELTAAVGEPAAIGLIETGASPSDARVEAEFSRRAAGSVPDEVSIAYYEPARDYQTGLQRAFRTGIASKPDRSSLPAAMSSSEIKGLAEQRLARLWAGRATGRIALPWARNDLRPGALVTVQGEPGIWKVERWTLKEMAVELELVRVPAGGSASSAEPGRPVTEPDLRHGPTSVRLLDIPLYRDEASERAQLFVAASGIEAGWRRADLLVSYDEGASWQPAGATAAPAIMGTALTTLSVAGTALIDDRGSVEVELLNAEMWLEGRSDDALATGANLALLGSELIQFGVAEPIGPKRFRLSRLLRGRMGTEWAAPIHEAGENFLLVEAGSLAVLDLPPGMRGGTLRLRAIGRDDGDSGVGEELTVVGDTLLPPAPVHLHAGRRPNGDLMINWVRRSRRGWTWLSGSDTPLGEEQQRYRLTFAGEAFGRTIELESTEYLYTQAMQGADGATGALTVSVEQVGTHGVSRAATISNV